MVSTCFYPLWLTWKQKALFDTWRWVMSLNWDGMLQQRKRGPTSAVRLAKKPKTTWPPKKYKPVKGIHLSYRIIVYVYIRTYIYIYIYLYQISLYIEMEREKQNKSGSLDKFLQKAAAKRGFMVADLKRYNDLNPCGLEISHILHMLASLKQQWPNAIYRLFTGSPSLRRFKLFRLETPHMGQAKHIFILRC